MTINRWLTLAAAALITLLEAVVFTTASGTNNEAASPPECARRLSIELTPDVPNPHDPGFLSSLLNNHPDYALTLEREGSGSVITVDLTGPGPDYLCRNVVETMRRDARVLGIHAQ